MGHPVQLFISINELIYTFTHDASLPRDIFGLRFVRLCKAILNVSFCSHQQFLCPRDCHWQQLSVLTPSPSSNQLEASITFLDQSEASHFQFLTPIKVDRIWCVLAVPVPQIVFCILRPIILATEMR